VEGEGPTAAFTFHGTPRALLPDVPPVEVTADGGDSR
jgi:ATP-dependent Clp protease ATP-binding subunit ClpC